MHQLIAILLYAAVWIFLGWLLSLYYKGFMCDAWRSCATCKHIERRWHKRAWIMDGVGAVLAVFYLFWLFK